MIRRFTKTETATGVSESPVLYVVLLGLETEDDAQIAGVVNDWSMITSLQSRGAGATPSETSSYCVKSATVPSPTA